MSVSPRALASLAALSLCSCGVVDPDTLPDLVPTLVLACEHPDMWFEGLYAGPDGLTPYTAERPHRPTVLRTQLARSDWDGPRGPVAQTACADVCVGTAEAGFYHHCPDEGWQIAAELTLAPPRIDLDAALEANACFPDSACTAAFTAPLGAHLRAPAAAIAGGRGQADHLGMSESILELQLPGARVEHPLRGLAEYSAGRCEDDRCLFYLANLQLDDRGARSHATLALTTPVVASLHGLRVELMQPALAEYTPSTGALRFPTGSLDLRIRLTVAAGGLVPAGARELRLRNPVELRGRFAAGALELTAELPFPAGSARLTLDLHPRAHPPVAAFDPPARLPAGPGGLALPRDPAVASALHRASDPDGDLRALHWVVDGVPGASHIPPGEHEVELWVVDRRGALDRSPRRTVTVTAR